MIEIPVLPDWAKDATHSTIDVSLGWRDRLRVLLGGLLEVRLTVFCENPPGKVDSCAQTRTYFNRARPQGVADSPGLEQRVQRVQDALLLIEAERRRQIYAEGWTAEHDDDEHRSTELADAAYSYWNAEGPDAPLPVHSWPWDPGSWKPKDRVRNLTRAGALYRAAHDQAVRRKEAQQVALLWEERFEMVARELSRALAEPPKVEST